MKISIAAATGSLSESGIEILYESANTRVFRQRSGTASVVCKAPLGADAAQRLQHEKSMLARLLGVAGVAQLAPGAYADTVLALQDCGGASLADVLFAGRLEFGELLKLAAQLARSVAAVHRAGVIHGDINPANILLDRDGEPVLIDFDFALPIASDAAPTRFNQSLGTPAYMAPEQTGRTGRSVDQRADLYALGVTMFEMATGQLPFAAHDPLQLIHDQLVREPLEPSQLDARVPHGLSRIIMRLLAKAPEQRYQSADGLLHDLVRLRRAFRRGYGGDFELGERDFSARLAAPARLVGRAGELARLREALADCLHTAHRTVLIEGAAGVGKSALVNELRPVVAAQGGWFVLGKFDLYLENGPGADALTQAMRALGRLLLAQTGEELAAQRQRIVDKLGRNAGLATRALPEFALLLGPQPEAPEVDPHQAEVRLLQATVDLIGAIASSERPLVIVLDDLHRAGALSLRIFERLMEDPGLRGLLLVGAYRDKETEGEQVLHPLLAKWRLRAEPPAQIALENLGPGDLGELVAQMLRLDHGLAGELARAVGAVTGGNPFETVEMINALRKNGVLSMRERGWHWDEAQIKQVIGRGNVVDLLTARIERLPAASREMLELVSCLGNAVDRKLLRTATGLHEAELHERLRIPLEDGLLVLDPVGGQDMVQFRHDRVQEAVLGAMSDEQRCERQLVMARRLADDPAFESDAAQQYLPSAGKLTDAGEQSRVARLFYAAAQKLAITASYLLAERYLAAAGSLLADVDDPADAPLRGAVDVARHAALYSLGRLEESDPLYAAMQARAADPLDLVEPTCLQMRRLDLRGQTDVAANLGLRLLAQLGIEAPPGYVGAHTEKKLDALAEWIEKDSRLDHSTRPQIQDRRLLAIAKLLGRTVRSSLVDYDTKVIVWLLLEAQRLWAEHGPCPELVANLGRMSSMLISLRGDYRGAFRIARHVLTVGEALG